MPNRSILVADDIENQTPAGKQRSHVISKIAAFLAQKLKSGIELLFVEDVSTYPAGKLGSFRYLAWHSQHEDRIEEVSRQYVMPVTCTLKRGHPAEQILKILRSRTSPELVVMGTQGRKGLKRLIIGSVAEEVVRHSKRPVVVIGPMAQERQLDLFKQKQLKILVPTDLGKNSRAAEEYALSLAKRIGARVTLFHCPWDTIQSIITNVAYTGMAAYNLDSAIDESRDEAVEIMRKKTAFFQKHGVPCDYKVEEKTVTSHCAVYQECENGYSLAVMGTHGRNAVLNAFFGSTARETILNAPIPVITVHSGK